MKIMSKFNHGICRLTCNMRQSGLTCCLETVKSRIALSVPFRLFHLLPNTINHNAFTTRLVKLTVGNPCRVGVSGGEKGRGDGAVIGSGH